jgi:hypothetical protein
MLFKSRTEAFTYSIWKISQLIEETQSEGEIKTITRCLQRFMDLMDKHEQDPSIFLRLLEFLKKRLSSVLNKQTIEDLQAIYLNSDFNQSAQEQFENPLGRRLESELGIELMLNPTSAMMESVGQVSAEIIKILDDMADKEELEARLLEFQEDFHTLGFGAFKTTPTVEELFEVLETNAPKQLIQIMFIHFRFGQFFLPFEPILDAPIRAPIGELKNIIRELYLHSDLSGFFKTKLQKKMPRMTYNTEDTEFTALNPRSYIADIKFYKSPLYTALRDRGRDGPIENVLTQQMGLMLLSQAQHEHALPTHESAWTADCKYQKADLSSAYVKDLIENDAVYVAGPSGMTGVLLGQMEILGNFETMALKQNYLTAVVAYMLSSGYHSLHEVIGPAEYVLNLVPGYKVQVPETGVLSPPPNFDQFYHQQKQIDPEFHSRYENAYLKYFSYFNTVYIPLNIPLEKLKTSIVEELGAYLMSLEIDLTNTTFLLETDFRFSKAKLAFKYRQLFNLEKNYDELKELVEKMESEHSTLEQKPISCFFSPIENSFQTCIEEIHSLCESFESILQERQTKSPNT